MDNNNQKYYFNRTAYSQEQNNTMRTAFLTAFPKIFTDIPFANAIFSETIQLAYEWHFSFKPEQFVSKLAIELEARHKAVSLVVNEYVKNISDRLIIIDLGAGLSSRRLEFKDVPYIEVDYPPMVEIKRRLYERLRCPAKSYELIGLNLTHVNELESITQSVQQLNLNCSVVVISEGLFWYLSRNDMQNLAKFVYKLISKFGGLWITGDCPPEVDIYKDYEYRSVIAQSSKRQMDKPFSSLSDFENFFKSYGFSINRTKIEQWVKPNEIISASIFASSPELTLSRLRAYTDIAELYI